MDLRISVNPYTKEGDNILGFANVVFDEQFVLENVRIRSGRIRPFVELPKYQVPARNSNGDILKDDEGKAIYNYKDVFHPSKSTVNKEFVDAVLTEYARVTSAEYQQERRAMGNNAPRERGGIYQLDGRFEIGRIYASDYNDVKYQNGEIPIPTVGIATVHFGDSFALEKARIKIGQYGPFVDLPKFRTAERDENGNTVIGEDGKPKLAYKDCFHAITKEAQAALSEAIIEAYNRAPVKQSKEQEQQANISNAPAASSTHDTFDDFDPLLISPDFGQGQGRN